MKEESADLAADGSFTWNGRRFHTDRRGGWTHNIALHHFLRVGKQGDSWVCWIEESGVAVSYLGNTTGSSRNRDGAIVAMVDFWQRHLVELLAHVTQAQLPEPPEKGVCAWNGKWRGLQFSSQKPWVWRCSHENIFFTVTMEPSGQGWFAHVAAAGHQAFQITGERSSSVHAALDWVLKQLRYEAKHRIEDDRIILNSLAKIMPEGA